jgi:hypothetical protein
VLLAVPVADEEAVPVAELEAVPVAVVLAVLLAVLVCVGVRVLVLDAVPVTDGTSTAGALMARALTISSGLKPVKLT